MILAIFEGERSLISARKSSRPGTKRFLKEIINDYHIKNFIMKQLLPKTTSNFNMQNYKFALFSGSDNDFMIIKLANKSLLAHKHCNYEDYLHLVSLHTAAEEQRSKVSSKITELNKQLTNLFQTYPPIT